MLNLYVLKCVFKKKIKTYNGQELQGRNVRESKKWTELLVNF